MTLCLNMIVKNEMANMERCLASVALHIDSWIICDTGSTDGTQDFVRSFLSDIPGELHSVPFQNFQQARNEALRCAYETQHNWDYLLLTDADMELMVEDRGFRDRLEAPGYRVKQITTGFDFSYWNPRIVSCNTGAYYQGVTHEYLDIQGGVENLDGIWFRDHASGSNRPGKLERDIVLLTEALEKEPGNTRSWFYLAQSYRDAGRLVDAINAYAKRASMGGWEEEAWRARLEEARCRLRIHDDEGFVRQALAAYKQRPHRAEPLHDLARYYRDRALKIPKPTGDILFLENLGD